MTCNVRECSKPIVGNAVVLQDEADPDRWDELDVYHGINDEGEVTSYLLLHPACFVKVFDEVLRQEGIATFFVAVMPVGDMREAIGLP